MLGRSLDISLGIASFCVTLLRRELRFTVSIELGNLYVRQKGIRRTASNSLPLFLLFGWIRELP